MQVFSIFVFAQLGYARQSVLASSWFVSAQVTHTNPNVCLCGEGRVGESLVRQWVEFYTSRVRTDSQWDALSKDKLTTVLEVTCLIAIQWNSLTNQLYFSSVWMCEEQLGCETNTQCNSRKSP